MVFRLILILFLSGLGSGWSRGADDAAPQVVDRNLIALNGVAEPLAAIIKEIDRLNAELASADTDSRKADLSSRILAERKRLEQLRGNFLEIVGGAEAAGYDEVKQAERTIQDQFSDILDPLVGALREPTEELRYTEQLRKDLAKWQDRHEKAERVIGRIDALLTVAVDAQVGAELEAAKRLWEGRRSEATGNIEVSRLQLEDRLKNTPTVWESISGMFRDFWATRGLNLILALAAAIGAWFLVRKGYDTLLRASPSLGRRGTFIAKATSMLALGFAFLAAILAVILVLFLRGDWLLLTFVIVLLLAAAWTGKSAIPPYIDQIKMLLNLGSVREGERVIHRGLPWEVTSLGFYSVFTNPLLEGGVLRIPLKDVMEMTSRQTGGREQWFPTSKDDWIVLGDGTHGKVIHQTPEQVVLLKLGGVLKTYPILDFLEHQPENLMKGFRVSTRFGVSYDCQPISTTEVGPKFQRAILESLSKEFGKESVKTVKVEFAEAGSSSLDYVVLADFSGDLAPRMKYLERMLQRVCVEVCNEQNWEIPFPQITLHQATILAEEEASKLRQ